MLTLLLPALAMLWLLPTNVEAQIDSDEAIYVSMLGTRKHRLSGVNPTVGLFYSTDGGLTWTHTGWKQGKAFAAVRPPGGGGDTVFVAAGNGVMRTIDGGNHWRITTGWEVTEVQDVALSARRPNDVFAATPYGIFRSRDFGGSWTRVGENITPPFVSTIRVDRVDSDRIRAGTESGLWVSSDGGEVWTRGPLRHAIRSIRQSPHNAAVWVAALQDHGVAVRVDGASAWRLSPDIDGLTVYEVEFDPFDAQRLVAGGWKTGLLESRDLGETWTQIDRNLPSEDIHGIAFSRAIPGLLFVGTMDEGVFVSKDGGKNFTAADPDIFEAGQIWDVYIGGEE